MKNLVLLNGMMLCDYRLGYLKCLIPLHWDIKDRAHVKENSILKYKV